MNCLKCGRETQDGRVFCDACMQVMEKYPVKPGASLQLPRRPEPDAAKKTAGKKRQASPEERVKKQRKTIRRMSLVIAALFVVICLLAGRLAQMQLAMEKEEQKGKNYTSQTEQ